MVILGEGGSRERDFMAMGPEKSKPPLHNFSMGCLKWGNQRFLRCSKVTPDGGVVAADQRSSPIRRREGSLTCSERSPSPREEIRGLKRSRVESDDGEGGIEAIRKKLMLDIQKAADRVKVNIMGIGAEPAPLPATFSATVEEDSAVRPWNLRTRRAACKAPNGDGAGKSSKIEERKHGFSPLRSENKSPKVRGDVAAAGALPEKQEKTKLTVGLSRREIEEDYFAILGEKPPRRPKKRPRAVQKNLDTLFPGLWLTEITTDTYKVPDFPESGKR